MNFLKGLKTSIIAVLVALLPNISTVVEAFVASHPGLVGGVVGGLFFLLRQVTNTESKLLLK